MVAAGKGRMEEVLVMLASGADAAAVSKDGATAAEWARRFGFDDVAEAIEQHRHEAEDQEERAANALALNHYQMSNDLDEVDLNLINELITYLVTGAEGQPLIDGAILVFLPGWDEIARLKDLLEVEGPGGLWILPLHSMVPPQEQRKCVLEGGREPSPLQLATPPL